MNRVIAVAAAGAIATLAITGCDRLVGDHVSPYPVASEADPDTSHLTPGLWRTVPPTSPDGCRYMLFRNGYPVQRVEVHDQIPVYVFLPETTADSEWGLSTVGCGTWERVTS